MNLFLTIVAIAGLILGIINTACVIVMHMTNGEIDSHSTAFWIIVSVISGVYLLCN